MGVAETAAFRLTKSAQEPDSGLKTAMLSGKTIYILGSLHHMAFQASRWGL
jgi:hypothetical protein